MGFGSFGSVNLLPTLGYGIGAAVETQLGPFCFTVHTVQPKATAFPVQPTSATTIKQPTAVPHVECC
jgi:hypothetical protein